MMRARAALLAMLLLYATRTAFALTCGGFSVVTADHVIIKYSAPVPAGATLSSPAVSLLGTNVTVSRNVSGGSATDVACVDDRVDLGYLGAGSFNLTWSDNFGFTTQRSTFTFFVGTAASGTGNETSVLLPLLPDQPVRLTVNACSQRAAVAYLSGNDILISQYGAGSGCKLYVLDFGVLPVGSYNVKTTRLDSSAPPSSTSFTFIVQQPGPASACSGTFSITRTERGTARLHYEDSYTGYAPAFGLSAVTEISQFVDSNNANWPVITIVQPVADTADTTRLAHGSAPTICHGEDIDIGAPAEGYNELQWYDQVSVNGFNVGFRDSTGAPVGFWWFDGVMRCSAFPRSFSPSAAIEEQPIHLALSVLRGEESFLRTTVTGHTVTIEIVPSLIEQAFPPYPPVCETWDAVLSPLPAGEYTVSWRSVLGGSILFQPIQSSFTVVKPTRRRAARP